MVDQIDASAKAIGSASADFFFFFLIGIFPDKFGLQERLTAREHIAYFAELHGLHGKTPVPRQCRKSSTT